MSMNPKSQLERMEMVERACKSWACWESLGEQDREEVIEEYCDIYDAGYAAGVSVKKQEK